MKARKIIIPIIIATILAVIDQFTKYLIIKNVELHKEIPLIGDVLVISHIHNSGAAWGSLSGKIPFLLLITAIVTIGICYIYKNIIDNPKYMPIKVCLVAIMGGAIGNLIDRIRLGYVTDFIYFKIINFPLFNFADICVTVSVFVLIFLFIFKYKSEDLDVVLGDKKTKNESGSDNSDNNEE